MAKVRYEVETGKVNLITTGEEELAVQGCKYMRLKTYPDFDHENENLYVRDGKVVAIRTTPSGIEHVRDVI